MSFVYNPFSFDEAFEQKPQIEYKIVVSYNSMHYRVKLTPDVISIGGETKDCVQITLKSKEIAWVKSSDIGECELNKKPVRGDDTIDMIHIGLWFLKHGYEDISYEVIPELELTDSSKFPCKLPDGSVRSMSLLHRDSLVHGESFYERKLFVKPRFKDGIKTMNVLRENLKTKQPHYDFRNEDLNKILTPLYQESVSWESFMKKLVKIYGSRNVCQVMYPWYLHAITDITGGKELPTRWVLTDLSPTIEPVIISAVKINNTTKRFSGGAIDVPNFHEGWDIYNMSYEHLISDHRKTKTRRSKGQRKHSSRSRRR